MSFSEAINGTEHGDIAIETSGPSATVKQEPAPTVNNLASQTGDNKYAAFSRWIQTNEALLTVAITLLAAVAAVISKGAPTELKIWDALLKGALAAHICWYGPRTSLRLLLISSGLCSFLVGLNLWVIAAIIAFCLTVTNFVTTQKSASRRLRSTLAAAIVVNLVLRLQIAEFGHSALLAGLIITALLISQVVSSTAKERLWFYFVFIFISTAMALIAAVGLHGVIGARSDAQAGLNAAKRGLSAARDANAEDVIRELNNAETHLNQAGAKLRSPKASILRLLPVASQNYWALATSINHGGVIAKEAARTLETVDLETLRLRQGDFDLSLLSDMAPQLERTAKSLEMALSDVTESKSQWLLPPVARPVQSLLNQIERVNPHAQLATQAAQNVPAILGEQSPRRYLVIFGSPSESREFGGFVGGYALLDVDNGRLRLLDSGGSGELVETARKGSIAEPETYPIEYMNVNPDVWPQNLTASPNIDVLLRGIREIFTTNLGGKEIDGMIYMDPYSLAALTELTGPIPVPGTGSELSGDAIARYLIYDQYHYFDTRHERFTSMSSVAQTTLQKIMEVELPGPERLSAVLEPMARSGRLQMITTEPEENDFLTNVKLQRQFSAPIGAETLAVIQTNGTASKLDAYLYRKIDYEFNVDVLGRVNIVGNVTLETEIADDVHPYTLGTSDGRHRVLLSVYSPHQLDSVTIDGEPLEYVTQEEFGLYRHAFFAAEVDANTSRNVRFELSGIAAPHRSVVVWTQPLVHQDSVRIRWNDPTGSYDSGWREEDENWVYVPGS